MAGTLFYQEVKRYDGSKSCVCVQQSRVEEKKDIALLSCHFPGGRDLFAVAVDLQLGPSGGRPVRDRARRLNGLLG